MDTPNKQDDMDKIPFRDRLRYQFDNLMARGTISLVAILFGITLLVVVAAGILVVLLEGKGGAAIGPSIWLSLMHAIDAGTLTADQGNWIFLLIMTIVTICGLFITSMLIGIINTGLADKLSTLRKGKSKVLERGHTIILGFNSSTYTLLSELIQANANQPGSVVVVMDAMEKEEMEDAIRQRIPDPGNTRIICRSGDIADFADLTVCSPEYCKSVIINSHDDFVTITAILAVTNLLKNSKNRNAFVTAVIKERDNYEAALIAGDGRAEILFFEETVANILANTCRQPGLSSVYTQLFGFGENEIYIEDIPWAVGKKMSELNLHFPRSTILGLERDGVPLLNPHGNITVKKGDQLILIAEDDSISIPREMAGAVDSSAIQNIPGNTPEPPQKMLILGYSPRLAQILLQEDMYMAMGSEIHIIVQNEYVDRLSELGSMRFKNIVTEVRLCDISQKKDLEKHLLWNPQSVLVSSSLLREPKRDDSQTLLLLLQVRAIAREHHLHPIITSEMRCVENQELAQVTEVRDLVISSRITSQMVAQISQTRVLRRVFQELLTSEGSEIYLRPAADYVALGTPVNMYTLCVAAARKNQIFMGYRRSLSDDKHFEMITNPDKDSVYTFGQHDRLLVLSED